VPRVPTLDGQQVRAAPLQAPMQDAGAFSGPARGLVKLGEGIAQAGTGTTGVAAAMDAFAEREQVRSDQDTAWRTQAEISKEFVGFESKSREMAQGRNAAGHAEAIDQWWTEAAERYGKDLTPGAKRLITRQLAAARTQSLQGAMRYQTDQLERSRVEALDGALNAEVQRATSSTDPAAAAGATANIRANLTEYAASAGKDAEWVNQQVLKRSSVIHLNAIGRMQQSDPAAAQTYFLANKDQIDGTKHDEVLRSLNTAAAANDGDKAADAVWSKMGPRTDGQPVELDKMMAALRSQFGNDKDRRDSALAGLRERAAAHNSAEAERGAQRVNTIMGAVANGASRAQVMKMPEFAQIGGERQGKILDYLENKSLRAEQQAAARESRAASAESRAETAARRADENRYRGNFAGYLVYSNPDTLAGMTDAQVQALLPELGPELTNRLVTQRRSITSKPEKLVEARMDQQDFDGIADRMGLSPFAPNKTEADKRNLGELKRRVEVLIDQAQQTKGRALTREEKNALMTNEMSRTVKFDHGWFSREREVPVIQLSPEDAKAVIVPQADKEKIAEALREMNKADPNNPAFAPTEDNMRRLYLQNRSRAAGLIDGK
jgi:hypothetical protein